MPSHVRIFFGIVVVVAAYWILSAILRLVSYHRHQINDVVIYVAIGSSIFMSLIYLIPAWFAAFRRRNWARWVFVAVVVSMQVLSLWQASYLYLYGATERFRQIGHIILRGYLTSPRVIAEAALLVTAIVFIFTGNARDWFEKPGAA